jgi:hypothetical protein
VIHSKVTARATSESVTRKLVEITLREPIRQAEVLTQNRPSTFTDLETAFEEVGPAKLTGKRLEPELASAPDCGNQRFTPHAP